MVIKGNELAVPEIYYRDVEEAFEELLFRSVLEEELRASTALSELHRPYLLTEEALGASAVLNMSHAQCKAPRDLLYVITANAPDVLELEYVGVKGGSFSSISAWLEPGEGIKAPLLLAGASGENRYMYTRSGQDTQILGSHRSGFDLVRIHNDDFSLSFAPTIERQQLLELAA